MKFADQDHAGSANGIAALAVLKMLLDALLRKDILTDEEAEIIINCAEIEVTNSNGSGNLGEAKTLIEKLLLDDETQEKTNF